MKKNRHLAWAKLTRVVDEICIAMDRAGSVDLEFRMHKAEDGIHIHIQGDYAPEYRDDMENLARLLCPKIRNPALVETYWELAGGDRYTSDSELSLVGQMLSSAHVEVGEREVSMELFMEM